MCESPLVICEAWAHIGTPKSAQKNKVMTGAAKLMFAARLCTGTPRMILLLADEQAARNFKSRSWMVQLSKTNGVEYTPLISQNGSEETYSSLGSVSLDD